MKPALLAAAVVVLSGCAYGTLIQDSHGNYFHSEEERRAWHEKHPDTADFVGKTLAAAISLWGIPDRHMTLDGGEVYEWGDTSVSEDDSILHFKFWCGRRLTVNSASVVTAAVGMGRCQ